MTRTAAQYAEALRAASKDTAAYRKTIADLSSAAAHLNADADVRAFFANRAIPVAEQGRVFNTALRETLPPSSSGGGRALPDPREGRGEGRTGGTAPCDNNHVSALLRVLIANRQIALLDQIIVSAGRIADAEDRTARVRVMTAVPLSERLRTRLESVIAATTGRRIAAVYEELPSLIGGIRIVIDGVTEWDATVAGRFERLHQRIRSTV